MSLFATKSIDRIRAEGLPVASEHGLKRVLTATDLTTLGIGAIIGTGIFVLTGQAAIARRGPGHRPVDGARRLRSALAGLCYAEFASTVPISGSAYTYGYATLGEFVAWIIGWDLILEYALGAATVAVGWSEYVISFLHDVGIQFPAAWSAAPGSVITLADGSAVTASSTCRRCSSPSLVTALLVVGIQESAWVNAVIVIIKVAIVLLVIAAGSMFINPANWTPFIPATTRPRVRTTTAGAASSAAPASSSSPSSASTRCRRPPRKPRTRRRTCRSASSGRWWCAPFSTCSFRRHGRPRALQRRLPRHGRREASMRQAQALASGSALAPLLNILPMLVKLGAIAGLSSVMVVMMLGQPRVFLSMANDGLLPVLLATSTRATARPTSRRSSRAWSWRWSPASCPINILGETGQHRDVAGVRDRVDRHPDAARQAARHPAAVPRAAVSVVSPLGSRSA